MMNPADSDCKASATPASAKLDDLFRRAVERRPDALALIDPPNREAFTDSPPCRLTYAQADRIVTAMARRMRQMGLHPDAIVGLQLANSVEGVLTLLAVLRAGLIAMPLPLLWRRADMVTALGRVGCSALIVSGRIGQTDHFDFTLQVASDMFSVRWVCGFGREPRDGVVLFDDLFAAEEPDPVPMECTRAPSQLAAVTWDVTADGLVPVGRSHAELIAGGLAVMLEGRITEDALLLSTITQSSFAGLAVTMIPWLLSGGTLALHHPFDQATFAEQCASLGSDTVIVPGVLAEQLAEAGLLSARDGVKNVIGVWRTPERLPRAPLWHDPAVALTDVHVFGEVGLIAARRGIVGAPVPLSAGPVMVPRGAEDAALVVEVGRTERGTVALRGPMVPLYAFPPGVERTALPALKPAADGFVDTGYPCRDGVDGLMVTGPPPSLVSVGGYRFVARDLQDLMRSVETSATLAALPDALAGHRLAGAAGEHGHVPETLTRLGLNPLLAGAFRFTGH
jgi:hypothetical protein